MDKLEPKELAAIALIGGVAYYLFRQQQNQTTALENATNPQLATNCRAYAERQREIATDDWWRWDNKKDGAAAYDAAYADCMAGLS